MLSLVGDLSPPSELEDALARITPYADEVATYGSVLSAGSTWHFVGLGLQALGRGPDAREAYARAAEVNDRAGALPAREESRRRLDLLSVDGPDGGKATATAG